jgi:hypothetical protein
MSKTVQILLSIADNAGLKSMDEWEQFIIFNKSHFLNQLTYDIFQVITDGYGTNLSKLELAKSLNIDDSYTNQRLFSVINKGSKTISYEEFHDFCALGQKHHIISLLKELKIHDKLYKESCNEYNMDATMPLHHIVEDKDNSSSNISIRDDESTELDYTGNNPAENSNILTKIRNWCNRLYDLIFNRCTDFSKK